MLVTRSNIADVVQKILNSPGWWACDTETTGLSAYKGDRPFAIIIGREEEVYYFNLIRYPNMPPDEWLLEEHVALLREVFLSKAHMWYLHNAKFDMHMLGQLGIEIAGPVYCTYGHARLIHNDLLGYGLDACAERWLGTNKDDAVIAYMDEHKLFTVREGGKTKRKNYHFWKVPLSVMQPYAELDTVLAYRLGKFEQAKIVMFDVARKSWMPPLFAVEDNETRLTKTLFEMERVGVKIDRDYTERALTQESAVFQQAMETFKAHVGLDFEDSPTLIGKAFKQLGIEPPKGPSGRILTNDEVLAKIEHPAIQAIRDYRRSYKLTGTYYANFLKLADHESVLHPDFHQGGTKTGRLSCRDPNLQNLPRPDDEAPAEAAQVRRCFVPREGFVFFAPDYDQIEYRMMLSYAGELDLIAKVLAGLDVHAATGEMLDMSRYDAKQINFMLIYGGGDAKLAQMTGKTLAEAKERKAHYFAKLPNIARFVERVRAKASDTLELFNWFGRRYTFAHPDMTYTTGPNWLIQGGCADVLKRAMNQLDDFLTARKARTRMVLNVHDEIVFELHKSEFELARPLVKIMETAYIPKHLPLTAGPSWSDTSLADKLDGYPGEGTRAAP